MGDVRPESTKRRGPRSRVARVLGRHRRTCGTDPHDANPYVIARTIRGLERVFGPRGPFPVSVEGWHHVPAAPGLFVSNHSGGSTALDAWGFGYGWYSHFGTARVLHVLVHEFLLSPPWLGPLLGRLGGLRASPGRARQVLAQWQRDLWVMPGGDRDTWRRWKDRYRVHFAGHLGYAHLALATGIPAIPVAHAGAHETLVVLTDGLRIARWLRLHELARIDVFPIHISLPWGICIGPLPHLPVPRRLRYRIGPPVPFPEGWRPDHDPTPAQVKAYDARVRADLQSLLDELAKEPTRR